MDSASLIKKFGSLFLNPERQKNLAGSLKVGHRISGRIVKRVAHDKYLVKIRGEDIIAESKNVLKEGIKYSFEVTQLKPKTALKLALPDIKTVEGKAELLNQMNLPGSKLNLSILDFFAGSKITFDRNELLLISSVLHSLFPEIKDGDELKRKIKAVFLLSRKNIPLNKELIETAAQYLFGKPEIDKDVKDALSFLRDYIFSGSASKEEKELFSLLEGLILKGNKEDDYNLLVRYFRLTGIDYEARINELIYNDETLKEFLNHPGIKGYILFLLLAADKGIRLNPLLQTVLEKILRIIEFQQVMNYFPKDIKNEYEKQYYYLLPLNVTDKLMPVEMHFKRKRTQESSVKKYVFSIFVFINDTECLKIHGEMVNREISIMFESESEIILRIFEGYLTELKKRIASLGFLLKNAGFNTVIDMKEERERIIFDSITQEVKKINVMI